MKHLKTFENSNEAEYIFSTSTQWVGTDHEEHLYDFTEEDFKDFNRGGHTFTEYEDKAIEYHGLSWELDEENGTLTTSTQWMGSEDEVDSEGYTENDYDELQDLAMMSQGIEFDVIENVNHPNYQIKIQSKKFNL